MAKKGFFFKGNGRGTNIFLRGKVKSELLMEVKKGFF